jgi:hypothetical protein
MTPEAQRIAIAEACGWKLVDDKLTGRMPGISDANYARFGNEPIPSFLTDLNATHTAEKVLTLDQRDHYLSWLGRITEVSRMASRNWTCVNATAAQRSEAFLRALNLWKD